MHCRPVCEPLCTSDWLVDDNFAGSHWVDARLGHASIAPHIFSECMRRISAAPTKGDDEQEPKPSSSSPSPPDHTLRVLSGPSDGPSPEYALRHAVAHFGAAAAFVAGATNEGCGDDDGGDTTDITAVSTRQLIAVLLHIDHWQRVYTSGAWTW